MRRRWKPGYLLAAVGVIAAVLVAVQEPAAADTFSDSGFGTERVATVPPYTLVGMAFAPDGRMFVWEKNGIVRVIKNGQLLPTPFIDLSAKVNTFDDRGFWGLAFDPQFASNGRIYMTYTFENAGNPNSSAPRTARLTRVTADPSNPDTALPGSEVVILGSVGTAPCSALPANADCIGSDGGSHTLGSLHFDHDGTLFVGVGDGSDGDVNSLRAQDLNSPNGKILRINADGSAPPDNPFYDGTNSWRSKVWLYGVRNPFGFSFQHDTEELYFGDVGWNTWEEVDHGGAGANFGWPCYEGNGPQPFFQSNFPGQCALTGVTPPFHTYNHSVGSAVIGGPFYTGTAYPQQFRDNFFFADYSGNFIKRVEFDSEHRPVSVQPFATDVQSPVALTLGPDGMIYYLSFTTGEIRRIRYDGPIAKASATPTYGPSPLPVSFSSAGSSAPGGGALSYLWDFGDGSTSTAANPTHTYTTSTPRRFTARLTVSTQTGTSSTDTVDVTAGSVPPTPTITSPTDGTTVLPGETVTYRGSGTDPEDGPLGASALKWTVLLHHNSHVHTFVGGTGLEGSFLAEDHGDIGTFSYEIILEATDSTGLKSATSVTVAVGSDTTPPSAPTGLTATASAAQVGLAWTASTDNAAVTGYRVERCQGTNCTTFTQVATPTGTTYTDTGLAASTTYRYQVRAVDASGNLSGYSTIATATTPDAPPTPPGLVGAWAFNEGTGTTTADASGNGNQGTLVGASWTTQGRYGGALSFNGSSLVRVADSASLDLTTAMTLSAWIMPTANQSGWRTILQRQTDAYFLNASNDAGPLRPAGGGTYGGSTSFVSGPTANPVNAWTHVALTYDGTTQRLYVNGTQVATRATTGTIQATDNPLWIGGNNPYGEYFTGLIDDVRIYNRALTQTDIQTDMSTGVVPGAGDTTPPSAPTGLTATASAGQVGLAWTASTDNVAVTGYRVERCQGTGCTTFTQVATPTGTTYTDTGLAPATTYRYQVRAVDAAGNLSTYSSIATATTPTAIDTTPPSAPTGLTATASAAQVGLAWTASTDNVAVTGYRVERCQGTNCTTFTQVATPTGTTYTDTGLAASTTYRYQVRAVDASGNLSGYSTIATATTPDAPPTPPGLVGAWAFNEGTGTTTADASGNGNQGTLVGASWTTQGRYGGALSFNGSSLVRVADSASLDLTTAMTLSAWIMPTANQSGWRTILQRQTDAYFLNASNDAGPLRPAGGGTYGGSTSFVSGPTANPVNAWTHVALTYDGTTQRLYVNGTQVATRATTGTIQATDNPLWIGGNNPYGEYFTGLIDDVRIYNRALTQTDIQTDMSTGVVPGAGDTTPPSAPTGLTATASAGQVGLAWTASTDNVAVTGYRVERCQGTGCTTFTQVATPTGTTYTDTGLAPATTYRYQVRAVDAAGNLSAYSSIATATTPTAVDTTPPSAPTGLTATASAAQVGLAWTASTDNVGVTGYRVERCQGTSCTTFTQVATPTGTTYTDTGLAPATTYRYQVRAVDAAGNLSTYSSIATATTPTAVDTTPPSAPTGLTATASAGQVGLAWTASTDNAAVTGYRVERCQGTSCTTFTQVATPTGTTYTDTGLAPATTYRYQVRAVDAAGNLSTYSSIATATTPTAIDTTPPSAPTGLTATASAAQVGLAWTASTDNAAVTGYRVERCQGTNCTTFTQVATPTGTTYTDTGLAPATTYRYQVRAVDAAGNLSAYSSIATATTPTAIDTTPPSAPTGLTATASAAQVGLAWTASTDNVAVTGYRVERCQGTSCTTFTQVATPTGTTYTDTGLAPATTYRYQVRAVDASGNLSAYSSIATATTPGAGDTTPPSAPTGLTATAGAAQVGLAWTASTDNVAVTGYRVERCQGTNCTTFTQVATPTGTTYTDTGLAANTSYRYRVRAVDAAGNLSAYSSIATSRTLAPDTTRPSAPTGLTATASAGQVGLAWTASTDNVAVAGYRVERCQGTGCTTFTQVATPTGTTYTDTGLAPATTYRYRVRAVDAAGNLSTYSSIATATTPTAVDTTPPSAPTGLTATASAAQVGLAWTASTDNAAVTGYRVERCQGTSCTTFTQVATPTGTTYTDTGLAASTTYRYQVRAVDASGNLSGYSTIATATTPDAPPTPPGLVGAWAFNEGTGTTTADASGNGNQGTLVGASWTTQGRYGGALSFNGSSLVRVADSASLDLTTAMTLSAWIMPTANQSGWRTILQRQTDAYFLNASNDAGPLRPAGGGTYGGSTSFVSGPTANPVNAWTHVALTYDGTTQRLYVNGTQVATRATTGTIQATDNPLWIGGNNPYGEYFTGLIDDVRIYNRALTQTDIQTDMSTGIIGP